jgi:uncharacterized membrane protein
MVLMARDPTHDKHRFGTREPFPGTSAAFPLNSLYPSLAATSGLLGRAGLGVFSVETVTDAVPISGEVTNALLGGSKYRLAYVDILRGVAMILMALDHTRDFFTSVQFAPEDLLLTNGPLFFTRWVTHFCAPIFFLLAGTGAYLSLSQGRPRGEVSRFLWTRGLWLVFLNLTVMAFGWTFTFPFYFSDVLWSLGWAMVVMAFVIYLPVRWIAALGAILIITHNMFDWVNPSSLGRFGDLWLILHGYGDFWIEPGKESFFVLFPLIPWVGVMAVGYALGALLRKENWKQIVLGTGAVLTSAFLFLRLFHLYGNGHHLWNGVAGGRWRIEPTLTLTIVSFFDTLKYPPSLQFLLMTLGPTLMVLPWLPSVNPKHWLARAIAIFGQVPLFYYVLHIYVIHMAAFYTALLCKQKAVWLLYGGPMLNDLPQGYGHGLPFIYAMWFAIVLFMYPLCRGFMKIKQAHRDWVWLRYL